MSMKPTDKQTIHWLESQIVGLKGERDYLRNQVERLVSDITSLIRERDQLREENERLREWDAQLRQWIIDHHVKVGEIDLDVEPGELMTLDELQAILKDKGQL